MRQAVDRRDSALGWAGATTGPTRLVLLRCEQSLISIRREYSGSRSSPSLTEVGRQQTETAVRHLVTLVDSGNLSSSMTVASPQHRTQQIAEATTKAPGLDIHAEEDLRETDFGQWKGVTPSEVHNAIPKRHSSWLADPTVAPPEGEDFYTVDS